MTARFDGQQSDVPAWLHALWACPDAAPADGLRQVCVDDHAMLAVLASLAALMALAVWYCAEDMARMWREERRVRRLGELTGVDREEGTADYDG